MKKKGIIIGVVIALLGVIFGGIVWGTYNDLVSKQNAVDKAWGDVQAAYQRRLDTIPKFAQNAQFSAQFQTKLATEYAKAREGVKAAATTEQPDALQVAAQQGFEGLMIAVRSEAVVEAKTDQLTELNAEIENVERVVNHERIAFNEAVRSNNDTVRKVPNSAFISWFGWDFQKSASFQAAPGAEKSPTYELKME